MQNIDEKIRNFLELVKENPDILRFQVLQNDLLEDSSLCKKIQKIHGLNKNDLAYKDLKKELFQNERYKEYLHLDQKITFWTYEMSQKLKDFIGNEKDENY